MRRSIKYGLYAAVIAGVLAGTIAWANVDKTVTVTVDGQPTKIHTTASTVKGVLDDAGDAVGPHDIVAPALTANISGGSTIVVKHGRLLHLTVDGQERDVWVTSTTVSQALADLGYENQDLSSVSRSKRLPLTPTDITLATTKVVTVTAGGHLTALTTTGMTVADVLTQQGIVLDADDTVTPAATTPITTGTAIIVKAVLHKQVTARQPLAYGSTTTSDPTAYKGTKTVIKSGVPGVAQVTYAVVYIDGVLVGRTIISTKVLTAPTNQVVKVGTKPQPPAAPPVTVTVDPGSAQAIAKQLLLARGWGNDQLSCLIQMWDHESGWRVNAGNASGAYGIPQALPGDKMASAGADWRTNPKTQIIWGLGYITGRYGTPCGAWGVWQQQGWY